MVWDHEGRTGPLGSGDHGPFGMGTPLILGKEDPGYLSVLKYFSGEGYQGEAMTDCPESSTLVLPCGGWSSPLSTHKLSRVLG